MSRIEKQLSNGQWQWLDESIPLLYNFNILLTAPPDAKEIRFNNAVYSSVTKIFIDDQEDSGVDISSILSMLQIGGVIALRNKNDTTKFVIFSIDSAIIDQTAYFEIPVDFEADGGFNFADFDELSISFYNNLENFNILKTFLFSDFAVASTTDNAEIFLAIAGEKIYDVFVEPTIVFAGTGITDVKCTIGVTGTETKYAPSFDIDQIADQQDNDNADVPNWTGTTSVKIFITSVGADLDQLSAGSVTIYVRTKKIKGL